MAEGGLPRACRASRRRIYPERYCEDIIARRMLFGTAILSRWRLEPRDIALTRSIVTVALRRSYHRAALAGLLEKACRGRPPPRMDLDCGGGSDFFSSAESRAVDLAVRATRSSEKRALRFSHQWVLRNLIRPRKNLLESDPLITTPAWLRRLAQNLWRAKRTDRKRHREDDTRSHGLSDPLIGRAAWCDRMPTVRCGFRLICQ